MGRFLKNTEIRQADQYSVVVPFGTTDVRPTSPVIGQLRYNTTLNALEVYSYGVWQKFSMVGNVEIVKDIFVGDGSSTSFGAMTYSYAFGEEAMTMVFIGNTHQNPAISYTYNGTTSITFTSPPPLGHSIVVLHNYTSTDYTGVPFVSPFVPPFSPDDFASLVGWYQAGVGQTDAGGGACSAWADQSGLGHTLNSPAGKQPLIQGDGTLLFAADGNDGMQAVFTMNQPSTQYILCKPISWTGTRYLSHGASFNNTYIQQDGATNQYRVDIVGGDPVNYLSAPTGVYAVFCAVYDGLATSVLQIDATFDVGDADPTNATGYTLGNQSFISAGTGANIQVKGLLLYNVAHDAAERAQVISHLQSLI